MRYWKWLVPLSLLLPACAVAQTQVQPVVSTGTAPNKSCSVGGGTGTACPVPVTVVGGSGGTNPAASATGAAVPANASYNGVNVGGNLQGQTGVNPSGSVYAAQTDLTSVGGTTVSTGTGAQGAGTQRVTVATDSATVAGSAALPAGSAIIGKVGIDQTTPGTTNAVSATNFPATVSVGTGAQGASSPRVTVATDTATVAGSATLPAGTNLIGKAGIDQTTNGTTNGVVPLPQTAGGVTIKSVQIANNTTSVAIDASAGQLYGIEAFNNGTSIGYVKLYDAAQGSTTCGSGTPKYRGMVPAPSSGGGGYIAMNGFGTPFATAISMCFTGGFGDSDTTAPAASTFELNFYYK
jgi:hypothetical protein